MPSVAGRLFVVADDHPLFRGALRAILRALGGDVRVLEAASFEEAAEVLSGEGAQADLLLLDLAMPGADGLAGLAFLRAEHPGVPVAVVSGTEDAATVRRALDLGASGFIPKSASFEAIRAAILSILDGEVHLPPGLSLGEEGDREVARLIARMRTLTPQQMRVLAMLGRGLLNKQIAHALGISEATVKAHVSAVLLKLDVDSRTQAVILLSRLDPALRVEGVGL